MKKIEGREIVATETEYGVEYSIDGEVFVTVADTEEDARLMRAVLEGAIVVREWYATDWSQI